MKTQLIKQTRSYLFYRDSLNTYLLRDRENFITIPISEAEAKAIRYMKKADFEAQCQTIFERAELISGNLSLLLTEAQTDN